MGIIFFFLLFFILVGLSVDTLYLGTFTSTGLPVPVATVMALAVAVAITFASYRYGSKWILKSVGAEKLDIQIPEQRELHNIVTELALASGCPMPQVYVTYDPAPNAFATGRGDKASALCVTTGLLVLLNREETQGVIGHELAHIRNNDIVVMMLVSVLLGGVALLADWAQRSVYSTRGLRRTGRRPWPIILPALLLIVFSPLISRLLAMAVSRQREYLADASAVEFTRNPVGLAKALEKIRDAAMPFHKASRGTAHLFFVNPLRRRVDNRTGRLADLLSTHPPINRRIMLLYQMGGLRPGRVESAAN